MTKTYDQMHSGLHWARGRASEYLCVNCGKTARDWAYAHRSGDQELVEEGRKYSENFEDYDPMCRSCHLKMDMSKDPSWANRLSNFSEQNDLRRTWAKKGRAAIQKKLDEGDPAIVAAFRSRGEALQKIRRTCAECGLESACGPLGQHQKFTGHVGYR